MVIDTGKICQGRKRWSLLDKNKIVNGNSKNLVHSTFPQPL